MVIASEAKQSIFAGSDKLEIATSAHTSRRTYGLLAMTGFAAVVARSEATTRSQTPHWRSPGGGMLSCRRRVSMLAGRQQHAQVFDQSMPPSRRNETSTASSVRHRRIPDDIWGAVRKGFLTAHGGDNAQPCHAGPDPASIFPVSPFRPSGHASLRPDGTFKIIAAR